jgi:hypothetical protein
MSKETLRSAVQALPRWADGKIREVPVELRTQILRAAEASGEPMSRFGESIGLSKTLLSNWSNRGHGKPAGKFRQMRIERSPMPSVGMGLMVQGPKGIKVSGMTVSELVELFSRLEER